MHLLIIPVGFILWYLAYENKPIDNEEAAYFLKEKNINKRNRLLRIFKESF